MFADYTLISWRWFNPRLLWVSLALLLVSGNLLAANVNLAWNASVSANVGGYKVYYGISSGVYTASVDAGKNTSYQVSGLQQGTPYYFAVTAYDLTKTVESGHSTEATAIATPLVNFTASQTSGTAPFAVNFTPTVTDGTITGWLWNFGDGTTNSGTTSTVPNAIKSYGIAGTYTVSLTVTGSGWSINKTYANLITVVQAVVFTASPTSGNAPLVTEFVPTVTGGTITSWQWSFGDGNTSGGTGSSVPSAIWSYANAGSYTVSLTVTGPGGSVTQTNPNFITVSASSSGSGATSSSTINGLVAAYSFDNNGGTPLDYSGNGYYGSALNAVTVPQGRFGSAMSFNGTNAWVSVGSKALLALSTGMTLEAWVYPTAAMSGLDTVVMKEQLATATTPGTATYLLAANNSANQPMSAVWNGSEAT
ncbi:MAG: fibronectin type III, partial [Candidatus Methylumidiphilus alinenensis]